MKYLESLKTLVDEPKYVMAACAVIFAAWAGMMVYEHNKCDGYVECAVERVQSWW